MRRLVREHRLAVAAFVCSWVVLIASAPGIPIVWDEGEYFVRARFIIQWIEQLPRSFSYEGVQRYWLFINYSEGHPAGFALLIALGQWLASPFMDPLMASRLGPITLFSAACAAVAVRLRATHGTTAAIVAPAALITFPRMFSEAHFATQDGQLTAWWLILWSVQTGFGAGTKAAIALGLILGFTTATKFTGWLAWGPTVLTEIAHHRSAVFRRLAIALPIAVLVFYAVNVPLWLHPIDGLREHFQRSLNRAGTIDVATQFFGRIHSTSHPLPWYNTLIWLAFVTPLPTLVLGVVGLGHCAIKRSSISLALIAHGMTMMIVRALPGAPAHDGIRLFLPAFGFWCVFAGIGAQTLMNAVPAATPARIWRIAAGAALAAAFVVNALNLARYYPQTLSHYNAIAGGLRGAAAKGMEPAYWWDAFDTDVVRWLNEHTGPTDAVAYSPVANVGFVRDRRGLRPPQVDPRKGPFKWYVLQNRPGVFSRTDRVLMRAATPAFVKYAGRRPTGTPVPRDLDVPLIAIFSFEQYERARTGKVTFTLR
jgi:hypothetical protein